MIVGSKRNQSKAQPKDKKKKTARRDKFAYLTIKEKQKKQVSIADHNQKPIHNKHTTHYLP